MKEKVFGIYRAIVTDVDDPKKLDRIKLRVPEVLGSTITDWVWPKHSFPNWSWKPVIGDKVWVEYEAGDVDRPLYSGTWYHLQKPSNASTLPEEVTAAYYRSRIIKTPHGHKILFRDEDPDNPSSQNGITIKTSGGHEIDLDDGNTELNIKHSDGVTKIEVDSSGNVKITAKAGSKVQLSGAAVLPLKGVVTTNHICAFTGSPHPMGSLDVEASG